MFLPKESGTTYELPPADMTPAVLYRLIDLGTQQVQYQNEIKHQRKLLFQWELHGEQKMKDGLPFSISKKYTYSANAKAAMRKDLESWRGLPFTDADFGKFDLRKLLGVPCMLNVMHVVAPNGEDKYANISSITKLIKGLPVPKPVNEVLWFSLDDFDPAVLAKLSERLQETIKKSPEYHEAAKKYEALISGKTPAEANLEQTLDDALPF